MNNESLGSSTIIQSDLDEIYSLLPEYWCVWKNRFNIWSVGEVDKSKVEECFSDIKDLVIWVRNKFGDYPY